MPEEPIPAGKFMLDKLLGEITTCKVFPVKLAGMKHQEQLSAMSQMLLFKTAFYCTIIRSHIRLTCITGIPQGTTMQTHCTDLESSYFQIKNLLPKAGCIWSCNISPKLKT